MPPLNRGQLQVVSDLQGQGQAGADAGVARVSLGGDKAFGEIASAFAGIGQRIGQLADKAAAREGDEAGREAGLDPEFRTRRDGTIRGTAFDAAGLDIAETRLKTSAAELFSQAWDKHKSSPQQLAKALDGAASGLIQGAPDELRPKLQLQLGAQRLTYMRQARREMEARVRAEQAAALQADLALSMRTAHQQAFALGRDAEADNVHAHNLTSYKQLLARRGPDGRPLLPPETQARLYRGMELETTTARLAGEMERLPTVAAKEAFLREVEKDFASSSGLARVYDFSEFQTVRRMLDGNLRQALTVERTNQAAIGNVLREVEKMAADGFSPGPQEMAALKAQIAATGSGEMALRLRDAEGLLDFQRHFSQQSPEALEQWASSERTRLGDKATVTELTRLRLADSMLTRMREGLKKDPYAWAKRAGVLPEIAELDIGDPDQSRPQAFENTTRLRVAQNAALEQHYGQRLPLLRPHERQRLTNAVAKGPEAALGVATAMVRGFGDAAPRALAEISKDAPELAALGALVLEEGDDGAARDGSVGLALQRLPDHGKRRKLPEKAILQPEVAKTYGSAFMAVPGAKSAVEELAGAIYEARATRGNFGAFNASEYQKALRQAAGETEAGGRTYGGIGSHRTGFAGFFGRQVLLPREIRQDAFDAVVDLITDEDLAATGHTLRDSKGRAIPAAALKRNGTFVALGSGRYHVALGDPDTAPQWVAGADGREAVIDLKALIPRLRRREPRYFIGGE